MFIFFPILQELLNDIMDRVAIFPGSFDPFTVGHEDIVLRGVELFDKVFIAVGYNSNKKEFFPVAKRVEWIKEVFWDNPKVLVRKYEGLTVDFATEVGARYILRGLRTSADFEYERAIAQVNKAMSKIDSVFLLTQPEHTPVNSSIVRDIIKHGGDASLFLPDKIKKRINDFMRK